MKSKITLIILIVVIVFLGALSFFFGYKYLNSNDKVNELTAQVTDLNTQIEDKDNTIKQMEEEKNSNTEETQQTEETQVENNTQESQNKSQFFCSEDDRCYIILSQFNTRGYVGGKDNDSSDNYFMMMYDYGNSRDYMCGQYYIENGKINLSLSGHNNHMRGLDIEEKYGSESTSLNYDEANGVISNDSITLYLEK